MAFRIISKPTCSYCAKAKELLDLKGLAYHEDSRATPEEQAAFKAEGHKSYPQIWDGNYKVGGYNDLVRYLEGLEPGDDAF